MSAGDLFDARAFTLGMIALVNPCGFALLPAYLGYFLGMRDTATDSRLVALNRAQVVGLAMSAGFLTVFGVLGLALAGVMSTLANDGTLWRVTIAIGVGLIALGLAMLAGYEPVLSLPKLERGTQSRSVTSMFLFGVSYAVASLSCTIGLFVNTVGTSASGESFGERLGGFLSYGVGMGLLATGLTLAVALGKRGIVDNVRRLLPHINRISAVILVVVGAYLVWYGYWAIDPIGRPAGPILWLEDRQTELSNWIDDRTLVLGWGFLLVNAGLAAAGLAARNLQRRDAPVVR